MGCQRKGGTFVAALIRTPKRNLQEWPKLFKQILFKVHAKRAPDKYLIHIFLHTIHETQTSSATMYKLENFINLRNLTKENAKIPTQLFASKKLRLPGTCYYSGFQNCRVNLSVCQCIYLSI